MKMRILVLCDDLWHPANNIQRGLGALADARFDLKYVTHGTQWSPAMMENFPIVIVAKANHFCATDQNPWLTPETQAAFKNFVYSGGGLLLMHAGTCYKDLPEMRSVAGGAFLSHPPQCPVIVQPTVGHPLVAGVNVFHVEDEHYQVVLDATDVDVFLQSYSAHGIQPAGWTRCEGSGRVCVLALGHTLEVWLHSEFQRLLLNALRWVAKLN